MAARIFPLFAGPPHGRIGLSQCHNCCWAESDSGVCRGKAALSSSCSCFEGLSDCTITDEAVDQNLGNLAPRDDTVARVTCLALIALEEHEPMLVGTIVVEPAGTHDGEWQAAHAHEAFGAPLPVVGFGRAVIASDSDW
jgi:hypothetical protein